MSPLLFALGCREPAPPSIALAAGGVEILAPEGVRKVTALDGEGVPLLTRRLPAPVERLQLGAPELRGAVSLRVETGSGGFALALPEMEGGLQVWVEAPAGQGRRPAEEGAEIPVILVEGEPVQVAISARSEAGGEGSIRAGEAEIYERLLPGEPVSALIALSGSTSVEVVVGEEARSFSLSARSISREEARERLSLAAVIFPADPSGAADLARPSGRVTLPSPGWQALLSKAGLGFRARDPLAPWGWFGVELENRGEEAISAALSLSITDASGRPEPAFRPRMREGDDGSGEVRALLRVPPGSARGALPLFVDEALFDPSRGPWTASVQILPIGGAAPLHEQVSPLYVQRGSTTQAAGLAGALLGAAGGALLLLLRGRAWLSSARTSELMTVALFGALSFWVGALGRVIGAGVAAALGPFSILVTGLADDALRYALTATLITLLPRPGTAALSALTGWLLSGVALGGFGPVEILFVGNRVLWLEGALYLFGLTRGRGWLRWSLGRRWLLLSAAFSLASVLDSATGLALHAALYRLYYAGWYVALVLLGPGFLYVWIACGLAAPFAESLRRIQR